MNPKLISRHPDASERDLVERLNTEGPESLQKMRPGAAFDSIWQEQPDQMKRVLPKRRKKRMQAFAACAVILLLVGAALYGLNESKPVPAESDPSSLDFRQLKDVLATRMVQPRGEERIDALSTPLNIVVEDEGVTLTLVKAYYDGKEVGIDYKVENRNGGAPLNRYNATFDWSATLVGADEKDQPLANLRKTRWILDDHSFAGTLYYSLYNFDGPQEIKLDLQARELASVPGDWRAQVTLSSAKADALTSTFVINESFDYRGKKIHVDRIQAGPLATVIYTTHNDVRGGENLRLSYSDDIGTYFAPDSRSSSMNAKENGDWEETLSLEPFSAIHAKPGSLTLNVSTVEQMKDSDTGTASQSLSGGLPLTLQGLEGDTMTLTDIDYREEGTFVRLKYNSPNPQSWIPYFVPSDAKEPADSKGKISGFERVSNSELLFEGVFEPMNPEDIPTFAATTYKSPASEQSFEIPLDWSKALPGRH